MSSNRYKQWQLYRYTSRWLRDAWSRYERSVIPMNILINMESIYLEEITNETLSLYEMKVYTNGLP